MLIRHLKISKYNESNYCYLVSSLNQHALVDPSDAQLVVDWLKELKVSVSEIWTTHHHKDHCGGNIELLQSFPGIKVIGSDQRIEGIPMNKMLQANDWKLGDLEIKKIRTPGHTLGSDCFFVTDPTGTKALFTGDTLFLGGIGKLFEGTPEDMYTSLETLKKLGNDTLVYPGHEYTKSNLEWSSKTFPDLQNVKERLAGLVDVNVPGTIGEELETNVFMMADDFRVTSKTGKTGADCLGLLRELKNRGVVKTILKAGDGKTFPKEGQTVHMHYTGTFKDGGKKFDSSVDRHEAFVTRIGVGEVIKGWDEGVVLMSLGEKAILNITYDFAYGDRGHPAGIPPKADLVFEVELLKII